MFDGSTRQYVQGHPPMAQVKSKNNSMADHKAWLNGIRKDIDYDNLTPADYAAMEADLQARPALPSEKHNTDRINRKFAQLAATIIFFIIYFIVVGIQRVFGTKWKTKREK